PWTACTCASSFMPTSTWASSSPTPACPASSLLGLKRSKHSPSSLRAASPSLVISNEAGRLFLPASLVRSCRPAQRDLRPSERFLRGEISLPLSSLHGPSHLFTNKTQ